MKASALKFSIQMEFIIVLPNLSETSGCSFYRDFQGWIFVPMHMNVAYCWKGSVLITHIDGIWNLVLGWVWMEMVVRQVVVLSCWCGRGVCEAFPMELVSGLFGQDSRARVCATTMWSLTFLSVSLNMYCYSFSLLATLSI